ncbi:unnamed protein product [Prunus armeniaca]
MAYSFPLPRIDQLVDATAYSGYNQIFMHPADREHTAFITDRGLYCYNVMLFGLKNAGATYQRLVNKIFAELIGTSMEVYVDDMLVKSRTADDHLQNLSLMFGTLKKYNMSLNPSKCAFGVSFGKFLGFMISQRRIEANPEKIQALLDMQVPKTKKDVQSLTGRVVALARLISKATNQCAPFLKALKGTKRPNGIELPIFYTSQALEDMEQRYPQLDKLAYTFVLSARKLRPYFQAHTIELFTNQPLRQVLQKPETFGRLIKWAIKLDEFDIRYHPRLAEKAQAVADFISELTPPSENDRPTDHVTEPPSASADTHPAEQAFDPIIPHWTLYVDSSCN